MIRVTKLADYGVLLMSWFARAEARHRRLGSKDPIPMVSATDLARHTGVPAPTVSKLLRQLATADLLASTRGVHGGYRLARPAAEIPVAALLEAIEGPIALTECMDDGPGCGMEPICSTRGSWGRINDALKRALSEISLEEMANEEARASTPTPGHPMSQPQTFTTESA
ncbi:MAG: SUF system Fe-S cluster assembly regulator [Planctomycetota bacterium]